MLCINQTERFSGMGIDQAHEQNVALIKGEGGTVGITEQESALLRWMDQKYADLQLSMTCYRQWRS